MRKTTIIILGIVSVLMFTECKKYQEGPLISFRSRKSRVEGKWKYDKILMNGVDKTSEYLNAKVEFAGDGTYTNIKYMPGVASPLESKGLWELANNDLCVDMTFAGCFGGTTVQRWNILKLKSGELWLEYIGYDSKTEWHLREAD